MTDILLRGPAKPSSLLLGTYLFAAPHSCCLRIKQFRPQILDNGESELGRHSVDKLEAFWKTLADSQGDVKAWLDDWVAVVTTGPAGRELWCFTASSRDLEAPEGLEEIQSDLPQITPSQLFACNTHTADASNCLSSESVCTPSFRLDAQHQRPWNLLACALAEKLAWKSGYRVLLSGSTIPMELPVKTSLYPLNHTTLLLTIRPSFVQSSSSTSLLPLNIPATCLASISLSPSQARRFSSSFDCLLGQNWRKGREDYITREILQGNVAGEWGVYWVQLPDGHGMLTVWPCHLAIPTSVPRSFSSPIASSSQPRIPPTDQSDLLSTAHSLFSFFSTYHSPSPPPADTAPDEMEDDIEMSDGFDDYGDGDGVTAMDNKAIRSGLPLGLVHIANGKEGAPAPEPVSAKSQPISGAGSDLDDLFSDSSSTPPLDPAPAPALALERVPRPESPIDYTSALISFDDGHRSPRVTRPTEDDDRASRGTEEVRDEKDAFVTEDDFAFFDSPIPDLDVMTEAEPASMTEIIGEEEVVMNGHTEAPHAPVEQSQEIDVEDFFKELTKERETGDAMDVDEPLPVLGPQQDATATEVPSDATGSSTQSPRPQPPAFQSPKKPPPLHPLIPASFSPLTLPHPSRYARYTGYPYAPPSPAPTASSSLLERLRPPAKKPCYADDWNLCEDEEDDDESDLGYTVPPTPISEFSDEDSPEEESRKSRSSATKDDEEGDDVMWGGMRCMGAEIILGLTESFKTAWNPAWGTVPTAIGNKLGKKRLKSKGKLDSGEVNRERLVKEVISNRTFRKSVLPRMGKDRKPESGWEKVLIKGGTTLHDLFPHIIPKTLKQPQIMTATSQTQSIVRLSISSLHYWSELGLDPVAGKKDIDMVVVCEQVEDGKTVGEGIRRCWEGARLGRVSWERDGEGVIVCTPYQLVDTTLRIARQSDLSKNIIIYVLTADNILSLPASPGPTARIIPLPTPRLFSTLDYTSIALETYDRLPNLIQPILSRGEALRLKESYKWADAPAWTLARREVAKPEFVLSYPIEDYDVFNRWRFFHLSYIVGEGGTVMWVGDGRGESWEASVLPERKGKWKDVVEGIWKFGSETVKKWAVEWRLVICKAGLMESEEIAAWREFLKTQPQLHTLLMSDPPTSSETETIVKPRAIANLNPSILVDPNTRLINSGLSCQQTVLPRCLPVELPLSSPTGNVETMYPLSTFLLTMATPESQHQTTAYHILNHVSLSSRKEEDIMAELGEEFYRLECIVRERHGGERWVDCVKWGEDVLEQCL